LAQLKKRVSLADYAAFELPRRVESIGQWIRESMRQEATGPAWDMRLREFDFHLENIRTP
jgi:hypothetical protein